MQTGEKTLEEVISAKDELLKNYKPKKGSENVFHIFLVKYSKLGPIKVPVEFFVQTFKEKAWKQFSKSAAAIGFETKVLHNPKLTSKQVGTAQKK